MKKTALVLLTIILLFFQGISYAEKIRPGILIDDFSPGSKELISILKNELEALLGKNVEISEKNIHHCKWNSKEAEKNYRDLLKNRNVNLIITIGILSSGIAVETGSFPKPLIAVGIIDPEVQNIRPPVNNSSGVKNLTYVLFNKSLERDLERFYRVYPYNRVGIVADKGIIDAVIKNNEPIKRIIKKKKAEFGIIPVNRGINDVLDNIEGYDAVYLGYFGRFEGAKKKELIEKLSSLKIPAFGSSLDDIEYGALAAVSPEEELVKLIRRIALNTESLFNGERLSSLPVNLRFEEKLTINMAAAANIGFSPKFAILSEAEVVNTLEKSDLEKIGIKEVIEEALKNNPDINIAKFDVEIADKNMRVTRTQYFPSLSVNARETIIDDERARASMGTQAEKTASGSLKVEQLVYSEELSSGLYVNRKNLEAQKEVYSTEVLNLINNSAKTYFDVLKAKTLTKIRKDNLELTKKHLSISKQREAVGYSGKSDIYRWESSLATATTDLFEAANSYRLSKINLNKILNRPLDSPISVKDESIDGDLYKYYISAQSYEYLDNPAGFKKFTGFLVKESILKSPELRQQKLLKKAYIRELKRYKRERYLPVASISGEASHIFDRSGEGSEVAGVDPEDNQWTLALNLSWPLFSGGSKTENRAKTEFQLKKIAKQIEKTEKDLEFNTRSAVLNVTNKIVNLESADKSADFANKSLVLVQDSYSRGNVSISELINAQNDSLSADLNYMNSVYDFLTAVFELERTIGSFTLLKDKSENFGFIKRMNDYMSLK